MTNDAANDDVLLCPVCAVEFDTVEDFRAHREEDSHRVRWLSRQYRTKRKSYIGNKNGLSISLSSNDNCVIHNDELSTFEITTGSAYDIPIKINPGNCVRTIRVPIVIQFIKFPYEDSEYFYVGRDLVIKAESFNLLDFGSYLPGVYPPSYNDELPKNLPLKKYSIPHWFQRAAFNNDPKEIHGVMKSSSNLTANNYVKFFKTLLWLEELQLQLDIQFYSQRSVQMRKIPLPEYRSNATCLELQVEGLSENRPCVMERDQVFVCRSDEVQPAGIAVQWYEGIVHKVNLNSIYLAFEQNQFTKEFRNYMRFDVEFIIGRYPLQVCHRALELCKDDGLYNYLFLPSPIKNFRLPEIRPCNTALAGNKEQMNAVRHIVARSSYPAPYLVFGPPGTGKTVTIVEAIKQILYNEDHTHVLACAPSNSAADVIAERLLDDFDENHVYRLYAKSRSRHLGTLSEKLFNVSNIRGDEVIYPAPHIIASKRVVVCTFIAAARIASATFPKGHFTHVILDEVGQATEPEALVSIAGNLTVKGQLVLAGDPHQLGPVIRNLQATGGGQIFPKNGLETSYLERLMSMDMYKINTEGNFDQRLVTKLLNNYRSHPQILKIPNELFYENELRAKGDESKINSLCKAPFLPRKNFPLIFHATKGQDRMDANSPSIYNREEVNVVIDYLKKIFNCKKPKIEASDVGIISPYRLQVGKLRDKVRQQLPKESADIKIGSVEDFQGAERKVILISTVRASKRRLAKDDVFKLGFVRNPKRFNVAVTRSEALLILIGNAEVLQLDRNWKKLIDHIVEGGGYVGERVPPPTENIDEIIYQMENLETSPLFKQVSQRQVLEAPAFNGY